MPFATLRLAPPGVKLIQTPAMLMAAIVASQAIRWRQGLPEKLGGWSAFFGFPVPGPIRELWAWADINLVEHLAMGGDQGVYALTNNSLQQIGPEFRLSNLPTFASTINQTTYQVTDVGSNATTNEAITLQTPYSVGGIALYPGNYQIISVQSVDTYTIQTSVKALSTAASGSLCAITTTGGSNIVKVSLNNHGKTQGQNFSIVLPTIVGGLTLFGFYQVSSVIDANNFNILTPNTAPFTQPALYGNTSAAQLLQWVVITQQPPGGGYGDGGYGTGGYGTGAPAPPIVGTPLMANDWCMENFGSALIIDPEDQPLFYWDPTSGLGGSQLIVPGPGAVHGMFIAMPQQMVVAYGAATQGAQDPMLVAWCDAGNFMVWTAAANNQAGTYRLTRGSRIVGGLQGPLQCMLWTDVGLWLMQYIGFPDVWGFLEISRGCGLIAKKACCVVGTNVFWMGFDGFFMYAGGGAQRIPCDLWDIIKSNINTAFYDNIRCGGNTPEDEVVWYYPSVNSASGENDSYVKMNVIEGEWDFGLLAVSEWIDQNIFGPPMSAMPTATAANAMVMQHEISNDANGAALPYSITTGFFQLSEAEDFVFADYCIPDFKWRRYPQGQMVSAQIQLTFFVQQEPDDPNDAPVAIGPYTVTNATGALDIRCRGRYFSVQISGSDLGSFMRLGGLKFRYAPDGRSG